MNNYTIWYKLKQEKIFFRCNFGANPLKMTINCTKNIQIKFIKFPVIPPFSRFHKLNKSQAIGTRKLKVLILYFRGLELVFLV